MKSLSLIIPVFNEEESLPKLFLAIKELNKEIERLGIECQYVFSDNSSTDNSQMLIRKFMSSTDLQITFIELHRNYGYQASLLNAMSIIDTDAVVLFQSDLQDPPELILRMIKDVIDNPNLQSIAGQIIKRSENKVDQLGRRLFYFCLSLVSDSVAYHNVQDFYLIKRRIYKSLVNSPSRFQFLRSRIASEFGFDKLISYERQKRASGVTKFNFPSKMDLALDGLLANSTKFRRFLVISSVGVSLLSVVSGFSLTFAYFLGWRSGAIGWVSLILIQLLILALASGLISLLLEYVGRIYQLLVQPVNVTFELYKK